MNSTFPSILDVFVNPNDVDLLDSLKVPHDKQHQNINDAMLNVQTRIGVTGSNVSTTIDYELHDTALGHNHDGVNSKTLANLSLGTLLMNAGPVEGYLTGSFIGAVCETTYVKKLFPATKTWFTDNGKSKKIIEEIIERNPNKTPSLITWNIYEKNGSTILTTIVDTVFYGSNGIVETNRTRTVSSSINYSNL